MEKKDHRKRFAQICAGIAAAIVFVSLTMTYSIFMDCFSDWPVAAQRFLAISSCAAIEGMSSALVYGLVFALTGTMERLIAFVGLGAIALVMGINIVTHAQNVRHLPISSWQQEYVSWVGPSVLIGVFVLLVGLVICRVETKILKLERDAEFAEKEAELNERISRAERPKAQRHATM